MVEPKPLFAFTTKFNRAVSVLETEIEISEPYHPESHDEDDAPKILKFKAVWDTGASRSVISPKVIKALGISEVDKIKNQTANGECMAGVYLVNIYLPNQVVFPAIRVMEGNIGSTDVLIGMDIIGSGDFAVTHRHMKTWMTFQIPSLKHIDFVDEINIKKGKHGFRKKATKKRSSGRKKKNNRKKS